MKVFSAVMPFRDTAREREFALQAIPSIIKLNPDELIIGVDAPASKEFLDFITDLCKDCNHLKILQIPHSDEWNFQLANIVWHCYKECRNDVILVFDVDTILRSTILSGLDLIGENGNAVVSFTKRLLTKSLSDYIHYCTYRLRVRQTSYVFSGVYWIYLPYYFENVQEEGIKKIRNGIDTYMAEQLLHNKTHNLVTLKAIGVDCLDYQNQDYPWHQFAAGIWYRANYKEFKQKRYEKIVRRGDTYSKRDVILKILLVNPFLFIFAKAMAYQHFYLLRGWRWASQHQDSEAFRAAKNLTYEDWTIFGGAKYVKNIQDWKRKGTGFS